MKSFGRIVSNAGKLLVVGTGLLAFAGCYTVKGNVDVDAHKKWVSGDNSFVASVNANLSYSDNINRNDLTLLKSYLGKNSVTGRENWVEYDIGGEVVWCSVGEDGGVNKREVGELLEAFKEFYLSDEGEKVGEFVGDYFNKEDLGELAVEFRNDLNGLESLVVDSLIDGDLYENKMGKISGEFDNIVKKYSKSFGEALGSFGKSTGKFADDYEIGGIPAGDLTVFGADLYGFLDIKVDDNSLTGGGRLGANASVDASVYSEQIFRLDEDPNIKVRFEKGITSNGTADFVLKADVYSKAEGGPSLDDLLNISELEKLVGSSDILDDLKNTKLPKVSAGANYNNLLGLSYGIWENDEFNFSVAEDIYLIVGFEDVTNYMKIDSTKFSSDFESNVKDGRVKFSLEQAEKKVFSDFFTPYIGLAFNSDEAFGRFDVGFKFNREQGSIKGSRIEGTYSLDDFTDANFAVINEKLDREWIRNSTEILGGGLLGFDFDFGNWSISPYASNAGVGGIIESRRLDAILDENGNLKASFAVVGDSISSDLYKNWLTASSDFVMENPGEIKNLRDDHILKNSGIFIEYDSNKSEFGVLGSLKNEFFVRTAFQDDVIDRYSLEVGEKKFSINGRYALGKANGETIENFGANLNYNLKNWAFSFRLFENENLSDKPFEDRTPIESGAVLSAVYHTKF